MIEIDPGTAMQGLTAWKTAVETVKQTIELVRAQPLTLIEATSIRYYLLPLVIAHFCTQLLIQVLTEPIPCVAHFFVLQTSSHDFFCARAGNEPNAKLITAAAKITLSMVTP
jgi:hypothetical protein